MKSVRVSEAAVAEARFAVRWWRSGPVPLAHTQGPSGVRVGEGGQTDFISAVHLPPGPLPGPRLARGVGKTWKAVNLCTPGPAAFGSRSCWGELFAFLSK